MVKYKFRSEEERNKELKNTLINVIKDGNNTSKIIEILAISSHFYDETYPLDWDKIKANKTLVEQMYLLHPNLSKQETPKTVDVPFAYFMLKHNQQVLLQRLIHEAENKNPKYKKPNITIPYRFIKSEDDKGNPKIVIQYLPKYDGTEKSEEARTTLSDVEYGSMQYYYYLNLPNYIDSISREMVIDQLRPFYLKDQAVKSFADTLKDSRYIDLLNGSVTLKPFVVENFDDTQNAFGFGVTLTDDAIYADLERQREQFERDHPELVRANG